MNTTPPQLKQLPIKSGERLFESKYIVVTKKAFRECNSDYYKIGKFIRKHFCCEWFHNNEKEQSKNFKAAIFGGEIISNFSIDRKNDLYIKTISIENAKRENTIKISIYTDKDRNKTTFCLASELMKIKS